MASWNGLNRRRFPRVKYPCLITLSSSEDALLTHTENMGIGGLGVIVNKNLKIYTEVNLEIDLMDLQEHIQCRGKVVWSIRRKEKESRKPLFYDIGIEFMGLGPADIQRLENIVQSLARANPEVII